jgi:hypothetical protein
MAFVDEWWRSGVSEDFRRGGGVVSVHLSQSNFIHLSRCSTFFGEFIQKSDDAYSRCL